jgi:hypothetical protein
MPGFTKPQNIARRVNNSGAGVKGSHIIITTASPFVTDNEKFIYAIETYNDGAAFTVLKEDDEAVAANRLNAGGDGYPARTIITGRFTHITPASGTICAGFVAYIHPNINRVVDK